MKELRALLEKVKDYKALSNEERTDERREQNKSDMARIAVIESDIKDLEEIEALETRMNASIKPPPVQEFRGIEVEDQPIYRGDCALGQQMVDIAIIGTPNSDGYAEARGRFDSMVKRERALAEKRAAGAGGMVMAVGQDGGLLLQGETAMDMISNGFNNSAILSRTSNRDLGNAQFVDLIGVEETSRANGSRGGGIRVYSDKELAAMTQSKTQFDKTRLEPKRLTGLYYASDEILSNAPMLQGEMSSLFTEEFAFKGQDLVINGTGSGEALGVLSAGCLVSQAKETGQTADTVVFENLIKMKSRIRMRNRNSVMWVANQDVEPQLYQLALPVGTGGSVMPVYIPSQDQSSGVAGNLLGFPIEFVEQCPTVGDLGDIILADWSMYYTASKGGVQSANSIHLKFDYNQTTFRFVYFFDGQPRMKSAITPYKGSNTVSSLVALAARA